MLQQISTDSLPDSFVVFDLETTGLDASQHEIIEIGCVLTTPSFEVIEKFEFKIKPERIENADPIAMKINHYNYHHSIMMIVVVSLDNFNNLYCCIFNVYVYLLLYVIQVCIIY